MKVKDGAIKLVIIFRILAGIASIPVAFETFSFCMRMKKKLHEPQYSEWTVGTLSCATCPPIFMARKCN